MPTPAKPCDAFFDEQTIASLQANRNRERWSTLACARCGQLVGAMLEKGKWTPETHWPSVRYAPHNRRIGARKSFIPG